jgi:hypothetical protein
MTSEGLARAPPENIGCRFFLHPALRNQIRSALEHREKSVSLCNKRILETTNQIWQEICLVHNNQFATVDENETQSVLTPPLQQNTERTS